MTTSPYITPDALSAEIGNKIHYQTQDLRRRLAEVQRDAQNALDQLDNGYVATSAQSLVYAGRNLARILSKLDVLTELAAASGLTKEQIIAAYNGTEQAIWFRTADEEM